MAQFSLTCRTPLLMCKEFNLIQVIFNACSGTSGQLELSMLRSMGIGCVLEAACTEFQGGYQNCGHCSTPEYV
jgi:hypothetical protein